MNKKNRKAIIICFSLIILGIGASPTSSTVDKTSKTYSSFYIENPIEGVIAYIELDGDIYLLNGERNERFQLTQDANRFRYQNPQFSPDGRMLAYLKNDPSQGESKFDLHGLDFETMNSRLLTENVDQWGNFDWSPDSQFIVFGYSLGISCEAVEKNSAKGIWKVSIESGQIEELVPPKNGNLPLKKPKYSFDSEWISYESYPCFSEGWNAHSWKISSHQEYNFGMSTLDWMQNQNLLALTEEVSGGGTGDLYRISPDLREKQLIFKPQDLAASNPYWSPEGNWLALRLLTRVEEFFFSEEEASDWVDKLVLVRSDGSQAQEICSTIEINACQFQSWSPTGSQIIFTTGSEPNQEWKLYSLESNSISNLTDFGIGGMDWIQSVTLPTSPSDNANFKTDVPATQSPLQSKAEQVKNNSNNNSFLIIFGVGVMVISVIILIFMVAFKRG